MASPPEPPLDWTSLHEDILDLILSKLTDLSDYFRVTAVCKPWQAAALLQKDRRRAELHKQIPMLLIPTKDRSRERRGLYSVTQNKELNLDLNVPYSKRFCGSSFGWLAAVEERDLSIILFNPFSGKTIRLPPVTKRPRVKISKRDPFRYDLHVAKVILSCDPALFPKDFLALAIDGEYGKLAYIKPGHKSWTYLFGRKSIGVVGKSLFADAIYYQERFFVSDHYCRVYAIDVSDYYKPRVTVVVPCATPESFYKTYIVQSVKGDLLLVQRNLEMTDHEIQFMTSSFKVFKLVDLGGDQQFLERVKIKNLGDDVLFLGSNHSQSVSALHFSGCLQRNCIYYTDDMTDFSCCEMGYRDSGIYCFEDKSIAQHNQMKARHRRMPPRIWVLPNSFLG